MSAAAVVQHATRVRSFASIGAGTYAAAGLGAAAVLAAGAIGRGQVATWEAAFTAALVAFAAHDLRYRVVRNGPVCVALAAALAAALVRADASLFAALVGALLFAAPYTLITVVWPAAVGAGDAKLAAFAGAAVSAPAAATALVVAVVAAGVLSAVLACTQGRRAAFPAGWSIAGGAVMVMFLGVS